MKQNEQLNEILQTVLGRRLGKAVNMLENYLLANPSQEDMDLLRGISDDYRLMADYWQRGFDDPQRSQVYDQLLRRMYVLTTNISLSRHLFSSSFIGAIYHRSRGVRIDWSVSAIRAKLEAFVSEVALLELEPEHTRRQKSDNLYRQHEELMRDLFDYILTSFQWRQSMADAVLDMLLSPTLASIDQQLMVSAITLSAMQHFCFQKFRVLCEIYRQASDESLRQAALVGWVLVADANAAALYTEMNTIVTSLCDDEEIQEELAQLQMQLVYCLQADADTSTIQKEILPDIMSGSKLKMTRGGLLEMDEDSLEDILHPEDSELAVEKMEQSMKRMVDMQKQGADIYFGGFSQMKRFSFFNDISNWFVPFYPQHPDISNVWNNARGGNFLKTITKLSAFCDSDKYSFVLAFNQVLDRLPQQMLKLIEEGEATALPMGGEVALEEQKAPAFIRRIYLQNLYRFFRLFPSRSEFCNPFEQSVYFFANPLFSIPQLYQQSMAVVRFLMKRRLYAEALAVLENISEEQRDYDFHILMGTVLQHLPEQAERSAADSFRLALQLQPESERAQAGLARALFNSQDYTEAMGIYEKLLALKPEHRTYQLNAAVCMLNVGREEEAQKLLYKLNYLYPDDLTVSRVLAWALTVNGKYEQAGKLYTQLLEIEKPQASDMLNYGYCQWFSKNVEGAIAMFRRFLDSQADGSSFDMASQFLKTEYPLIVRQGISDDEIRLMLDAITL